MKQTKSECIEFNGVKFYRYPNGPNETNRKYYTPRISDKKRGVESLHREVWKFHRGPIPDGHHVHHKDGNALNNDISNLECLSAFDHLSAHGSMPPTQKELDHLSAIRLLAAPWHSSPDGIAWHSENGKRSWENKQPKTKSCLHCGAEYQTLVDAHSRYCSNNCRAAARRARKADHEQRTCAVCSGSFLADKYSKTKSCGGACAYRLRAQIVNG